MIDSTVYRIHKQLKPYALDIQEQSTKTYAQLMAYQASDSHVFESASLLYYNENVFIQMESEKIEVLKRTENYSEIVSYF